MLKKKILVIAPVLPHEADIESIAKSLAFLYEDYHIDFIDPLTIMQDLPNDAYYKLWEQEIGKKVATYDIFFGFSFGGVILQQCFSLFSTINKTIVLFSTPTRADSALTEKLGNVIKLCQENKVNEALVMLYNDVYYPDNPPAPFPEHPHDAIAAKRLVFGLTRVLETDSTKIVQEARVKHLHLMGENSQLVNAKNVIAPLCGSLVIVPCAGMRVLEANLPYCKQEILKALSVV